VFYEPASGDENNERDFFCLQSKWIALAAKLLRDAQGACPTIRVTRWVCKKIAQMLPKPVVCQNQCITFFAENSGPTILVYIGYFQSLLKRKQSPNGRKFAQSVHPANHSLKFCWFRGTIVVGQVQALQMQSFLAVEKKTTMDFLTLSTYVHRVLAHSH
jgi:hypothetical protein